MSRTMSASVFTTLVVLLSAGAQAQLCRVTVEGNDSSDGSNWTTEAMDLHSALADTGCDEIWVAGGLYRTGEAGDIDASFVIDRTVRLYGGFDISATSLDQRNASSNPTVLSGDIDANDTVNAHGVTEYADDIVGTNCRHVMWVDGTTESGPILGNTIIDGFVITAGHALGGWSEQYSGGGIYCKGKEDNNICSPTLNNMLIIGNLAEHGAAIYNDGGSNGQSSPTLKNSIVMNNHSVWSHGTIHNYASGIDGVSSPVFQNVIISGNRADGGGGGLVNEAQIGVASPTLSEVSFIANSAAAGGAVYNAAISGTVRPILNNVSFIGNDAQYGGAVYNLSKSGLVSTTYRNVTFSGNSATSKGGAIFGTTYPGGRIEPLLSNVILWGNDAPVGPEISNEGATPEIVDSIVQGGCPAGSLCSGIIDADPLLGELANNGGFTPTLLPGAGGAAIDAGNPTEGCHGADQRGVSRPQGGGCDIGAVEARVLELTVAVSGQGSVEATTAPVSGSIGDCDLGGSACTARYTEGTIVELLLSGESNWHVDSVQGCGGELTGTVFTVPPLANDCTVTVTFTLDQYMLEYSAGPNGILAGQTTQVIDHGADGTQVAAIANKGYHFAQWSDGSTDALRTDTNVTADLAITAEFAQNPIDGQCGSADGGVFTQAPEADLCAAGSPSDVLGEGPWTWTCQGLAGGNNATCSAQYQPPEETLFGDRFEG